MDLENKVFIITGGGHRPGIGSFAAKNLLGAGANLVINSRRFDPDWQIELSNHSNVRLVIGDVTQIDTQIAIVETATSTWGTIHGVINNASTGTPSFDKHGMISIDTWHDNFLLNCTSIYRLSMLCWPVMKQHRGSIVNISSRAAMKPGASTNIAYSISKSAMIKLTQELAMQFAPSVNVNCVSPGLVTTQRNLSMAGDRIERIQDSWKVASKMQSTISLDEIYNTIKLCLVNPAMTGQNIAVCGCAAL